MNLNLTSESNIFNYLSYLTEFAPNAKLFINFKRLYANITFNNENIKVEYLQNLSKNCNNLPSNYIELNLKIVGDILCHFGLDIDGDVIELDTFIMAKNRIKENKLDFNNYNMEENNMKKLVTIQKREKLNDVYHVDERGPGGAYHEYNIMLSNTDLMDVQEPKILASIKFQKGPRKDPNSQHGVIDTDLLEIVRDRLKCFQKGDFASEYNAKALEHIEIALMYLNRRVEDRIERNVLGTNEK